ncbi:MAG TPA: PfkB family carbohydrate kinase [Candidatus Nanopelagicaceae bacterium]|nr:PfkB family carbohydrate kinase [Candidatus Nanopelagicaceae bacterium]
MGFDDLTTPAGRASEIPGGSALYFTLAAAPYCQVRPVAVLGEDGDLLAELLQQPGVDPSGLARRPGPSYRWQAVHAADKAVPLREEQSFGVYSDWRPQVPSVARGSQLLFLGSMLPLAQVRVLGQCRRAELIGLDTMRDFISSDFDRVAQLLGVTDLLFANRAELEQLWPHPGGAERAASELLGRGRLRAVVLKLGEAGAMLLTRSGTRHFPADPVERVVDPTGAGDSLAGGMMGRLAQLRRIDDGALEMALPAGLRAAARAISAFGVRGLLEAVTGTQGQSNSPENANRAAS